jgi:hypothetical protein
MKKLIIAPLMLAALFAVVGGARQPVAAAPTAPEFGDCRWYCNSGRSFTTLKACQAVCGNECEQIC